MTSFQIFKEKKDLFSFSCGARTLEGTGCWRRHPGARQADVTQALTGHSVAEHVRMALPFRSSLRTSKLGKRGQRPFSKTKFPALGRVCGCFPSLSFHSWKRGTRAHTCTCTRAYMHTPHVHNTHMRTHTRRTCTSAHAHTTRAHTCPCTYTHTLSHARAHTQLPGAFRGSGCLYGHLLRAGTLSISWTLGQPCEVTRTVVPVLYTRNLTLRG